ncbi:MAG: glycerophosphodiester phosphodiesterase family protein [Nesterenkonia sp.]|nr:glycerophosphodiester phosphodiesterase family protein [Nesterenkonia sp.]
MSDHGDGADAQFRRHIPYLVNTHEGPLHGRPLGLAHRGAAREVQNTMAAFSRAVGLGFRYLELDVRTAACGTLVVFHDERLDPTTDAEGPLAHWTWEQLQQVRLGGEPLALFEDVLLRWDDVRLNVDLKDEAAVDPFVRLVERHGAHDRVLVASFSDARRRRAQRLLSRPTAGSGGTRSTALWVLLGPVAGLLARVTGDAGSRALRRLSGDVDCLQVPRRHGRITVVTEEFVRRCHRAGLQVHVWTVDDAEEMRELLAMGVDGIITDEAETLAAVLTEHDAWPQRPSGP